MANDTLALLLERLIWVEQELDHLDAALSDYAETLQGNDFPEQGTLATIMENACLSVSHETATSIGFAREYIATLDRFIRFRRKYHIFSSDELSALIDGPSPCPHIKQQLASRFDSPQTFLQEIDRLRREWNATFQRRSYAKVNDFR